jgi:hypothetical protein
VAKDSNESCRFGKSLVCPRCKSTSNFDFSTDLIIDYLMIGAVCPCCGKEFRATLDSITDNKSMRHGKKHDKPEVRESCRMGKSFVCSSCGNSIDFDLITDASIKELRIVGSCPFCDADILLALDSFLNNRAVLICPEEPEAERTPQSRKASAQPRRHKQKAEKLDYIR